MKKFLLTFFSVLLVLGVGLGLSPILESKTKQTPKVHAATSGIFQMVDGASFRQHWDPARSGITFGALVSYDMLAKVPVAQYENGSIIGYKSALGGEIDLNTSIRLMIIPYDYINTVFNNDKNGAIKKCVAEGYYPYLFAKEDSNKYPEGFTTTTTKDNASTAVNYSASIVYVPTLLDSTKPYTTKVIDDKEVPLYLIYGGLKNIQADNMSRKFFAMFYYDTGSTKLYPTGDGINDGTQLKTQYACATDSDGNAIKGATFTTASNSTRLNSEMRIARSMAFVASATYVNSGIDGFSATGYNENFAKAGAMRYMEMAVKTAVKKSQGGDTTLADKIIYDTNNGTQNTSIVSATAVGTLLDDYLHLENIVVKANGTNVNVGQRLDFAVNYGANLASYIYNVGGLQGEKTASNASFFIHTAKGCASGVVGDAKIGKESLSNKLTLKIAKYDLGTTGVTLTAQAPRATFFGELYNDGTFENFKNEAALNGGTRYEGQKNYILDVYRRYNSTTGVLKDKFAVRRNPKVTLVCPDVTSSQMLGDKTLNLEQIIEYEDVKFYQSSSDSSYFDEFGVPTDKAPSETAVMNFAVYVPYNPNSGSNISENFIGRVSKSKAFSMSKHMQTYKINYQYYDSYGFSDKTEVKINSASTARTEKYYLGQTLKLYSETINNTLTAGYTPYLSTSRSGEKATTYTTNYEVEGTSTESGYTPTYTVYYMPNIYTYRLQCVDTEGNLLTKKVLDLPIKYGYPYDLSTPQFIGYTSSADYSAIGGGDNITGLYNVIGDSLYTIEYSNSNYRQNLKSVTYDDGKTGYFWESDSSEHTTFDNGNFSQSTGYWRKYWAMTDSSHTAAYKSKDIYLEFEFMYTGTVNNDVNDSFGIRIGKVGTNGSTDITPQNAQEVFFNMYFGYGTGYGVDSAKLFRLYTTNAPSQQTVKNFTDANFVSNTLENTWNKIAIWKYDPAGDRNGGFNIYINDAFLVKIDQSNYSSALGDLLDGDSYIALQTNRVGFKVRNVKISNGSDSSSVVTTLNTVNNYERFSTSINHDEFYFETKITVNSVNKNTYPKAGIVLKGVNGGGSYDNYEKSILFYWDFGKVELDDELPLYTGKSAAVSAVMKLSEESGYQWAEQGINANRDSLGEDKWMGEIHAVVNGITNLTTVHTFSLYKKGAKIVFMVDGKAYLTINNDEFAGNCIVGVFSQESVATFSQGKCIYNDTDTLNAIFAERELYDGINLDCNSSDWADYKGKTLTYSGQNSGESVSFKAVLKNDFIYVLGEAITKTYQDAYAKDGKEVMASDLNNSFVFQAWYSYDKYLSGTNENNFWQSFVTSAKACANIGGYKMTCQQQADGMYKHTVEIAMGYGLYDNAVRGNTIQGEPYGIMVFNYKPGFNASANWTDWGKYIVTGAGIFDGIPEWNNTGYTKNEDNSNKFTLTVDHMYNGKIFATTTESVAYGNSITISGKTDMSGLRPINSTMTYHMDAQGKTVVYQYEKIPSNVLSSSGGEIMFSYNQSFKDYFTPADAAEKGTTQWDMHTAGNVYIEFYDTTNYANNIILRPDWWQDVPTGSAFAKNGEVISTYEKGNPEMAMRLFRNCSVSVRAVRSGNNVTVTQYLCELGSGKPVITNTFNFICTDNPISYRIINNSCGVTLNNNLESGSVLTLDGSTIGDTTTSTYGLGTYSYSGSWDARVHLAIHRPVLKGSVITFNGASNENFSVLELNRDLGIHTSNSPDYGHAIINAVNASDYEGGPARLVDTTWLSPSTYVVSQDCYIAINYRKTDNSVVTEDIKTIFTNKFNIVLNLTSSLNTNDTYTNLKPIGVNSVNHRGYCAGAPENTLAAYAESKAHGFNMAECDIDFPSDYSTNGHAVLLHDGTIDRTSNGTGSVNSLTLAQLKGYDFSYIDNGGVDIQDYIDNYKGEKIPTLLEFLLQCKNLKMYPYLEVKSANQQQVYSLVALVKSLDMEEDVTWISFNHEILVNIKNASPIARLGYLYQGALDTAFLTNINALKTGCNDVFLDTNYVYVDTSAEATSVVETLQKYGFGLEVWTVNDENVMREVYNVTGGYVSGFTSDRLRAKDYIG